MERIYHARLQDFRRGLTRLRFKGLFKFVTGKERWRKAYCALVQAAMAYRYRHHAGMAIPMTPKDLSLNPVFEFKESDKIRVGPGPHVDGKRIRELFVTVIYAGHLDRLVEYNGFSIAGKKMLIAYPDEDRGVDTAIFITEDAPLISDGNYSFRAIAGKSSLTFYIQVKEYYHYSDFQKAILHPRAFRISDFDVVKLRSYRGLILIYIRSFCVVSFSDVKAELAKHGLADANIVLIGTEALQGEPPGKLPTDYIIWDFKQDATFTIPIPFCDLFRTEEEVKTLKLPIAKPESIKEN